MNEVRFHASRFHVGLGWSTVLGLLALSTYGVARHGLSEWGVTSGILLLLAAYIGAGLAGRSRPLVELSGDAVVWRILIGFRTPRSVPFSEIAGTEVKTPWTLRLRSRSGEIYRMPLHQLSPADRRAVRDAIESRLSRRDP